MNLGNEAIKYKWSTNKSTVQKGVYDWINDRSENFINPLSLTLTLKKTTGNYLEVVKKLDKNDVIINTKHFLNYLNRKIYGNKPYRKLKVKSLIKIELNNDNRYHLHLMIEKPEKYTDSNFIDLIKSCWNKTFYAYNVMKFDYLKTETDIKKWVKYLSKGNSLIDSLDIYSSSILENEDWVKSKRGSKGVKNTYTVRPNTRKVSKLHAKYLMKIKN